MNQESLLYKIWRIVYPLLAYFLLDMLMVWAVQYLLAPRAQDGTPVFEAYSSAVASSVFLAVSILVCYLFFRRDAYPRADWIVRHPAYFPLILVTGALASHGLSALVSLLRLDQIAGDYTQIQDAIFAAPVILVILQTVILAPISEELLFRGVLYKRLEHYTGNFWISTLVSSAIFGLYHLNLAQGVFAFLFGILACAVYDRIKNLWATIVLHIGGNLLSVILVYTGFDYPETGLLIAGMAAALAAAWALYHFLLRPLKAKTEKEMG